MRRVIFFRNVGITVSLEIFVNGFFVFICGAAGTGAGGVVVAGCVGDVETGGCEEGCRLENLMLVGVVQWIGMENV